MPMVTPIAGFGRGGISAISAGCTVKVTTTATSMPSAEMIAELGEPGIARRHEGEERERRADRARA